MCSVLCVKLSNIRGTWVKGPTIATSATIPANLWLFQNAKKQSPCWIWNETPAVQELSPSSLHTSPARSPRPNTHSLSRQIQHRGLTTPGPFLFLLPCLKHSSVFAYFLLAFRVPGQGLPSMPFLITVSLITSPYPHPPPSSVWKGLAILWCLWDL